MPNKHKILTEKYIQSLKPTEKEYLVADFDGLYIRVTPQSTKTWRYRYTFKGKPDGFSLGLYGRGRVSLDSVFIAHI